MTENIEQIEPTEFWSGTDEKGISAKCYYHSSQNLFQVVVNKENLTKYKVFPAIYIPTFGMDAQDQDMSIMYAEELAKEIEKELNI